MSDTDVERRNPVFIPKEPSPVSSGHYPSDIDYPEQEDDITEGSLDLSSISGTSDEDSEARLRTSFNLRDIAIPVNTVPVRRGSNQDRRSRGNRDYS